MQWNENMNLFRFNSVTRMCIYTYRTSKCFALTNFKLVFRSIFRRWTNKCWKKTNKTTLKKTTEKEDGKRKWNQNSFMHVNVLLRINEYVEINGSVLNAAPLNDTHIFLISIYFLRSLFSCFVSTKNQNSLRQHTSTHPIYWIHLLQWQEINAGVS